MHSIEFVSRFRDINDNGRKRNEWISGALPNQGELEASHNSERGAALEACEYYYLKHGY